MTLTLASSCTRKSSEDRPTLLNSCESSYFDRQLAGAGKQSFQSLRSQAGAWERAVAT